MGLKRRMLTMMLLIGAFASPTLGQEQDAREQESVRPWWVSAEFGEGQLQLTSDQVSGKRHPTFALGFAGGHSLGNHARIGLEVNGWLLEAYNLQDPTQGISVSSASAVVDAFPIPKSPFFVRAGAGASSLTNNHPDGHGGNGWCWTAGAGYEIPIKKNLGLAPMMLYSAGRFGDAHDIVTIETGRRYSVIEFKVAVVWHFGKPRKI